MNRYVVLPKIKVNGANAQSAWWLVSGVSPLTWMGLARKLALDMGVKDSHKVSVAILHHDTEMRGDVFSGTLHPWQLIGNCFTTKKYGESNDYVAGAMSMGLQPVALCNLSVTLIIKGLGAIDTDELAQRLLRSRVAGGTVQSCQAAKKVQFDELLRAVGAGFFLRERGDLLTGIPCDQRIDAFVRQMRASRSDSNKKAWLIPMNLGYLPISPLTRKTSARGAMPHAYAEPLVGLVQYVSKNSIDDLSELFWVYRKKDDAFVVTQN